ncbi:MAG: hypothetical protein HZA54_15390 [Planctomycetes bacterium]|nr:hypothetical protein [Planctomycetota bacterium]
MKWKIEGWQRTLEDMVAGSTPAKDGSHRYEFITRRVSVGELSATQDVATSADPDLTALQEKLDTLRIDLDFTDATLSEIVEYIRQVARIDIEIDVAVLQEGIADKRITFQMREFVLRTLLKLLLRQYGLDFALQGTIVVISQRSPTEDEPRDLLETLRSTSGSSEEQAGRGEAEAGAGASSSGAPAETPALTPDQLRRRRTPAAPLSFRVEDMPLTCLVAYLYEATGESIHIDPESVPRAGFLRVSLVADRLPLAVVLHRVCAPLGLTFRVDTEAIRIRNRE